jgi:phosphoribosylamine--glycine ligase
MKILVIGGGGREHALAWKLAQSDKAKEIYLAPGNAGTAVDGRFENIEITGVQELCAWAASQKIALTVVGPEAPLAAGVVDEFRKQGLRVFGPTRAAAQLESSKAFSKAFMKRHGIPTAEYETFVDAAMAHNYIDDKGAPIVVKADGLAAGKGVVVAMTLTEAHAAVDLMLGGGASGLNHNEDLDGKLMPRVVIEEFLSGEEASFIVMCDGKNVLALATSQDHKRLMNDDLGPNTGGMGAYSPAPVVTPDVHARAMREIILPTIRGMEKDGIPYSGFLYAGLMIDASGRPKALEFNCRMGDPEAQVILMRLKTDLVDVMLAATEPGPHGRLNDIELQWDRRTALGVVLAAQGYPSQPRQGDVISGLPAEDEDAVVFHGATALKDGVAVTSGGRVLCVTVLADNVKQAQQRAYEIALGIHFDGRQYRTDIGHRANRN